MTSTIFALATTPGRSALAVVRLSGSHSSTALTQLGGSLPSPRRASVRVLKCPGTGAVLDQALVLWLPGPGSYTGEDQAELHLHGGPAVIEGVLQALADLGLRPAEPGAFTRRAFENGKLDLSRAEAIADLIDAETGAQRRQALAQLGGRTADGEARWRAGLIEIAALLEASIDFPDEEIPDGVASEAQLRLAELTTELRVAAADTRGERVRSGVRVALVGAPNAGKSSLLNALAERDAAIVTEIAGTTRDIIEVPIVVDGYRVILADTAGVRDTRDRIEAEGVRRARQWAEAADLRLFVIDRSGEALGLETELMRPGDVLVLNKSDLAEGRVADDARELAAANGGVVCVCAAWADDVEQVRLTLASRVGELVAGSDLPVVTRLRHRQLLLEAVEHLDRALASSRAAELCAEDVRLAARALERISGRIDTEAVLDHVFSSFCIGK